MSSMSLIIHASPLSLFVLNKEEWNKRQNFAEFSNYKFSHQSQDNALLGALVFIHYIDTGKC